MRGIKPNFGQLLGKFAENTDKAISNSVTAKIDAEFDNIAVFGLGMNRIAGEILKDYLAPKKEITIIDDFVLSDKINSRTLIFILDYSGDNEEVINLYRNAVRKGCQIVAISLGGKLETLCSSQGKKHIKIPYGVYEDESFPYFFFSMLALLHNIKYVEDQNLFLNDAVKTLSKNIFSQKGEELANRIKGRIPLIYATNKYVSVASCWKTSINIFGGMHAFSNSLIEAEYSDALAFVRLNGGYYVIVIRDNEEDPRVKKGIDTLKEKIKSAGIDVIEIGITGGCYLTKLLSASLIGFWVSYYLSRKDVLI